MPQNITSLGWRPNGRCARSEERSSGGTKLAYLHRLIRLKLLPTSRQRGCAHHGGITGPNRFSEQRHIQLQPAVLLGRDRAAVGGQGWHAVLRIHHQIIQVVPGGQASQAEGLKSSKHLNTGRYAANNHRMGQHQSQ